MIKRASSEPNHKPDTTASKAERANRLAAEMRKNLMKRKHQQREKTAERDGESSDQAEPVDGV